MASVTFPTNLGGSGATISDDNDPNTGLANGGHRTRFIPALQGTIDMASYVYQYADKIDDAAADADRAENARGYVEAVADQYQVNILQQYKDRAVLDLDFEKGVYKKDDNNATVTENINDVMTMTRISSKYEIGVNGTARDVPIDEIARTWRDGRCLGYHHEQTSTNIALRSSMTDFPWTLEAVQNVSQTMLGYDGTYKPIAVVVPNTSDSAHFYYQSGVTVTPGSTYTQSVWLPKIRPFDIRFIYRSDGTAPISSSTPPTKIDEANGWERFSYTFENPADSTILQLRLYIYQGNDINYPGDGVTGLPVDGIQLEEGTVATSNINTSTSPVTRSNDILGTGLLGLGGFSSQQGFTVYGRFKLEGNRINPDTATGILNFFQDSGFDYGTTEFFARNDAGTAGRIRFQSDIFPNIIDDIDPRNPYDSEWRSFAISLKDGKQVLRVDGYESIYFEDADPDVFFESTKSLGVFSYSRSFSNRPPGSAYMSSLTVVPYAMSEAECSEVVSALGG